MLVINAKYLVSYFKENHTSSLSYYVYYSFFQGSHRRQETGQYTLLVLTKPTLHIHSIYISEMK